MIEHKRRKRWWMRLSGGRTDEFAVVAFMTITGFMATVLLGGGVLAVGALVEHVGILGVVKIAGGIMAIAAVSLLAARVLLRIGEEAYR